MGENISDTAVIVLRDHPRRLPLTVLYYSIENYKLVCLPCVQAAS